jgi:hypothetical protein
MPGSVITSCLLVGMMALTSLTGDLCARPAGLASRSPGGGF